ncbi:MAG TPA: hypothetical protein VLA66_02100 [Thermoanaerobaculia bacterium]|nr:hypothetical protein [Thermoanaerobaculia bacterium]
MQSARIPSLRSAALAAIALLTLLGSAAASAQTGVLGLVLDETRVREGSTEASVVVRSTSARGLSSGSFTIQLRDKDGANDSPYTALLGVEVLSGSGDAVANATYDPVTFRTDVSFTSASGTVNDSFGPMVILTYALDPTLVDNRRFILRLDPDTISLQAANGQPVFYFTEKGRVRVDRSDADVSIEAEASHAVPGFDAVIGAKTEILGELASGTIEILYQPGLANGPATASIHPAYGSAVIDSVSEPEPGRVLVTFHSTGGDLNTLIPGPFLAVSIPTRPDVPVGSRYDVILGLNTVVLDGNGQVVEVDRDEPENLRFVRPRLQFQSGFDDGTTDDFWDDNP